MKTVKLFTDPEFDARDVLLVLTRNAPLRNGQNAPYTTGEVRSAVKVLDKLEAAEPAGDLVLEDAEWSWLKGRLDKQEWVVATASVVRLVDAVEGAV